MPTVTLVNVVTRAKNSTDDVSSANLTAGFSMVDEFTYRLSGGTFAIFNNVTRKSETVKGNDYLYPVIAPHDGQCVPQIYGALITSISGQGAGANLSVVGMEIPGYDRSRTNYASCNYSA